MNGPALVPGTVEVFSVSQIPGVESEALIGLFRRRAHFRTSKEVASTWVGGLGPGEIEN